MLLRPVAEQKRKAWVIFGSNKLNTNLVEKDLALDDASERTETALIDTHRLLVKLESIFFFTAKDSMVRQLGDVHGLVNRHK